MWRDYWQFAGKSNAPTQSDEYGSCIVLLQYWIRIFTDNTIINGRAHQGSSILLGGNNIFIIKKSRWFSSANQQSDFFQHPVETYGYGLLFSVCGYLGVQIVLTLVQCCGAFVAATVTTCRKAVTIIISFIFFYKPFTFQYVWSGLIVLLGIYLNVYSKQRGSEKIPILGRLYLSIANCWQRHNRIQRNLMTNV